MSETSYILVIEDSGPDRLRIRSILEMLNKQFIFAWDADKKQVKSVKEIMARIKQMKPQKIILDMAWTVEDDKKVQELLFGSCKEIADIRDENGNVSWISGFELLKQIKDHAETDKFKDMYKDVYIVTQYMPPLAVGMRQFLRNQFNIPPNNIFHKWRDEKKLVDKLV